MTALLMIFVTKLSSGFLLYLFQNSSVSILDWEIVEDDADLELDVEELDSDDALERNDDVESLNFCFPSLLSKDWTTESSSTFDLWAVLMWSIRLLLLVSFLSQ